MGTFFREIKRFNYSASINFSIYTFPMTGARANWDDPSDTSPLGNRQYIQTGLLPNAKCINIYYMTSSCPCSIRFFQGK